MHYYGTRLSDNLSRRDPEGYLLCLNVPVARTGVQEYLPDELGLCSISLISRRNAFLSKASQAYALLLKQLVDVGTWRMIGGA